MGRRISAWLVRLGERCREWPDPLPLVYDDFCLALLRSNEQTHNSRRNQRCFILGGGPSLKDQNLSLLHKEATIAVNGFFRHPHAAKIQSEYYCLSGDLFFDGSDYSNDFLRDLLAVVRRAEFFVPLVNAHEVKQQHVLPWDKLHFLPYNGSCLFHPLRDVSLQQSVPQNVNILQMAIIVAMHLGCNPIYILGADHDWLATRNQYNHFVEEKERRSNFRYFEDWSYHEKVKATLQIWEGYLAIQKFATERGFRIVNLTPDSYLDIFECGVLERIVH